jgi:transposase
MIPEAREVRLSRKDRKVLEACCRSPVTLQRDLKRARIVLLAAAGRSTRSIAKEVGVQPRIVSLWRHRYADQGLEGLQDKPRPGKQPIYTKTTDKRILKLLDKPPPQGFARWTGPLLAEALGDVDVQYVWRFLRSHKIDLAARKSWCESNDPNFTAKAADVVGLYVAPPAKAIVLCVDEKPSIQALERAQGYLKLPNGRALTGQSHDYKRHGTTTLFAALEVATGKIIATHSKRRRRVEFLDFSHVGDHREDRAGTSNCGSGTGQAAYFIRCRGRVDGTGTRSSSERVILRDGRGRFVNGHAGGPGRRRVTVLGKPLTPLTAASLRSGDDTASRR